jgi:hypothetical protein
LQGKPEPSHFYVSNWEHAGLPLRKEHGNDTTPTAHHVAITYNAKTSVCTLAGVGISRSKNLLGAQLGGSVQVRGVHGLVSAQGDSLSHPTFEGSNNDVLRSQDIGLDCLEGIILTGWDLFQSRRVYNAIDTGTSPFESIQIPNISEEIAHITLIMHLGHFELFEFVTAENDKLLRGMVCL